MASKDLNEPLQNYISFEVAEKEPEFGKKVTMPPSLPLHLDTTQESIIQDSSNHHGMSFTLKVPTEYNQQMTLSPQFLSPRAESSDRGYDNLTEFKKKMILSSFMITNGIQNLLYAIVLYAWVPQMARNDLDESKIAIVLSGFGLGGFLALGMFRLFLQKFRRGTVWFFILVLFNGSFVLFAILFKHYNPTSLWIAGSFGCLVFAGGCQFVTRSFIQSTTSKMYPKNSATMLQLSTATFSLGNFVGPLTAAFLQDMVGLHNVIHGYTILTALVMLVALLYMPESTPQKKGESSVSAWTLFKNYRGLSNILNVFFSTSFLRLQCNGTAMYLTQIFGLGPLGVAEVIDVMTFGSLASSVLSIFALALLDHRIIHLFFTLLLPLIGYLITGLFFEWTSPNIYVVVVGLILIRFNNSLAATANTDITWVCKEMTGEEVNLATKDVVAIVVSITTAVANLSGAVLLALGYKIMPFADQISSASIFIGILFVNYIWASGIPKMKSWWKQ